MSLVSELKEFLEMDPQYQLALFSLLWRATNKQWRPILNPLRMPFKEGESPKEIVTRYLTINNAQIPLEMDADVNWPKLYNNLVKKGLIILVTQEEEEK